MVGIKVYNKTGSVKYLELVPGTQLRMENLFPAFDDQLESGIFSFPLEVPWTDGNKEWLGFVENLNSHNALIPDYWRCDIISNGIPYLLDAKLKMLTHAGRFDNKRGSYNFTISGIKGLFGTLIKGKNLRDLALEGKIQWADTDDSRTFAFKVMDYQDPANFAKLNFAPVAIEDFIDTGRSDFNTEFLSNDIVNNMLVDPAFPDGWIFGREKPGFNNVALPSGTPGYENYRTIPFLNLFFVLKQIFLEHGFTAEGSFFSYPDFELLHVFNTVSIELYDFPFAIDVNRQIIPNRHLPDMLIVDFLVALQNTFNLQMDFLEGKRVLINFKKELLTSTRIKNFTSKCVSVYDEAARHEAYEGGVKLEWVWDSSDSYRTDKVKDMKDKNIIAEVNVVGDIASLVLPAIVNDTTFIYVKAENYYYNFNFTSGWSPAIEQHADWKLGKEQISFSPELSPLCNYYKVDVFGTTNRMNMVASRQSGNYFNDSRVFVESEFTLRLFYIKQLTTLTFTGMPISFCHNYDLIGNKLADTSLSWKAPDGLHSKFWMTWIDMLINSWIVKSRFILDVVDLFTIGQTDVVLVNNNQYLIKKISHELPVRGETEIELVKL